MPMILVDIYKKLIEIKGGMRFFEKSNLVLQLWMMDHLHAPYLIKSDVIDRFFSGQVKAMEERMNFDKFSLPLRVEAWIEFLESRINDNVLWTDFWLHPKTILVGCSMQILLVLLGLTCTRPYTPLRVMCQLGRLQDVPLVMDLQKDVEYFRDQAKDEIKYE